MSLTFLATLIIVLVIVALCLYAARMIPDPVISRIIQIVVLIVVILWLLSLIVPLGRLSG